MRCPPKYELEAICRSPDQIESMQCSDDVDDDLSEPDDAATVAFPDAGGIAGVDAELARTGGAGKKKDKKKTGGFQSMGLSSNVRRIVTGNLPSCHRPLFFGCRYSNPLCERVIASPRPSSAAPSRR